MLSIDATDVDDAVGVDVVVVVVIGVAFSRDSVDARTRRTGWRRRRGAVLHRGVAAEEKERREARSGRRKADGEAPSVVADILFLFFLTKSSQKNENDERKHSHFFLTLSLVASFARARGALFRCCCCFFLFLMWRRAAAAFCSSSSRRSNTSNGSGRCCDLWTKATSKTSTSASASALIEKNVATSFLFLRPAAAAITATATVAPLPRLFPLHSRSIGGVPEGAQIFDRCARTERNCFAFFFYLACVFRNSRKN